MVAKESRYLIIYIYVYIHNSELMQRSELMAKCRHNNKFLLSNYKSND